MHGLHRLWRRVRKLRREECAAALPIVALSLPALIGAGALAVDAAHLYSMRGSLQATADASARAAAWEIPDASAVRQRAIAYAESNMAPARHGQTLAPGDVVLGHWDTSSRTFTPGGNTTNAVRVMTRRTEASGNPVQLALAPVFGMAQGDVTASAVAMLQTDSKACVLALAPTGTGLRISGNVSIDATQCGFAANSSSPDAALVTDGASATAFLRSLHLTGGMDDQHGVINTTEPPMVNTGRTLPDPYDDRDFDYPTAASPTWNANSSPSNQVTLEPGVYPNGFTFQGDVELQPGTYVMQGDVRINSQANVVGDDVTIVMDNGAEITANGGASTNLAAPRNGPNRGVVLMSRGTSPASHTINGGSGLRFTGSVYMPNDDLTFGGTSTPGGCLQIVAHTVRFAGNPDFEVNCDPLNTEDIDITIVSLVS